LKRAFTVVVLAIVNNAGRQNTSGNPPDGIEPSEGIFVNPAVARHLIAYATVSNAVTSPVFRWQRPLPAPRFSVSGAVLSAA
jgi:hypothetical protein